MVAGRFFPVFLHLLVFLIAVAWNNITLENKIQKMQTIIRQTSIQDNKIVTNWSAPINHDIRNSCNLWTSIDTIFTLHVHFYR